MKHVVRSLLVLAVIILFGTAAIAEAIVSEGYEQYNSGGLFIELSYPLDLWYMDSGGTVEFPIDVAIEAHPYEGWFQVSPRETLWGRWVPSKATVYIMARERVGDSWTPSSWLLLGIAQVISQGSGTIRHDEYKAGISGSYGDGENYEIGIKYEVIFNYETTNPFSKGTTTQYTTYGGWYRLGYSYVDYAQQVGINVVDFGIVNRIMVPNQDAAVRDGRWIEFSVCVEVSYYLYLQYWFWWAAYGENGLKSRTFTIGDNSPSSDAKLYIIEATEVGNY